MTIQFSQTSTWTRTIGIRMACRIAPLSLIPIQRQCRITSPLLACAGSLAGTLRQSMRPWLCRLLCAALRIPAKHQYSILFPITKWFNYFDNKKPYQTAVNLMSPTCFVDHDIIFCDQLIVLASADTHRATSGRPPGYHGVGMSHTELPVALRQASSSTR